jgi:hypothetical protein
MIDKDPTAWSIGTWLLAVAMAMGGGVINWYSKVKQGHTRVINFVELIGEMFTSGFVGIITFMALAAWNIPMGLCAAAAGIGGHMATRLLFLLEKAVEGRIKDLGKIKD